MGGLSKNRKNASEAQQITPLYGGRRVWTAAAQKSENYVAKIKREPGSC